MGKRLGFNESRKKLQRALMEQQQYVVPDSTSGPSGGNATWNINLSPNSGASSSPPNHSHTHIFSFLTLAAFCLTCPDVPSHSE